MTTEGLFSRVPFHHHGDHLTGTQTLTSFPDLHATSTFEERGRQIKQALRRQIIQSDPKVVERYVNVRECFKLNQRKYIEFCLQHKVPGMTFEQAAKFLGVRK